MKLIIDIPEEVVTAIQNGEDYRYDIHTAIAQGIPYEPKGDLISREALKKHKFTTQVANGVEIIDIEVVPVAGIDNAPTVEPVKQCKYCKHCGNEDYCSNCHSDHSLFEYYERPQGEWIDYDNTFYKCPDCGYLLEKCCPRCQNKVILPKGGAE